MRNEDDTDQLPEGIESVQIWPTEDEIAATQMSNGEMKKFRVPKDMTSCEAYWISDSEEIIDGEDESENDRREKEINSDDEMCYTKDEDAGDFETIQAEARLSDSNIEVNMEEKIIEFVKKNAILYNKRLRAYRNSTLKYRLWSNLATMLDSDVVTIKTKWKSLRDRYVRELKKGDKPTKSTYLDPWPYFEALSFLKECTVRRSAKKNTPRAPKGEYVFVKTPQTPVSKVELKDEVPSPASGPSRAKIAKQHFAYEQQDLSYRLPTLQETSERATSPQSESNTRHKHFGFLEMLRQQLEKFPDDMCDDIKIEILIWVHEKMKDLRNSS